MRGLLLTAVAFILLIVIACAVLILCTPTIAYAANPCADTVELPDGRASVSRACAVNAASLRLDLKDLRADLLTCTAKRTASDTHHRALMDACDRQVVSQRAMLDRAAVARPVPWWESRWLFAAGGAVVGGGLVWVWRR
jgi:hypothetical protein